MKTIKIPCLMLSLLVGFWSLVADAEMYKCLDKTGKTKYQATKCPVLDKVSTVKLTDEVNGMLRLDSEEVATFTELEQITVNGQLSPEQLAKLDSGVGHSNPAIKALALVLYYKYEPNRREILLRPLYKIFHYQSPSDDKPVPFNDTQALIKQIETLNPKLSSQGISLLSYLYFKAHPLNYLDPKGTSVSTATVLRTTFFSAIFHGSDVEATELIKKLY